MISGNASARQRRRQGDQQGGSQRQECQPRPRRHNNADMRPALPDTQLAGGKSSHIFKQKGAGQQSCLNQPANDQTIAGCQQH